jgi:plasmid stability protein
MATITIRNIEDELYERLKREAKANHRSLEAEARARLVEAPRMSRSEVIERLRSVRLPTGPDYEGSVALIRAVRDEE